MEQKLRSEISRKEWKDVAREVSKKLNIEFIFGEEFACYEHGYKLLPNNLTILVREKDLVNNDF